MPTNWSGLGWNPRWKTISSFCPTMTFGRKNLSKPHGNHFSMDCHVFQSGFFRWRSPTASRHSVSKKQGFCQFIGDVTKFGPGLEVINLSRKPTDLGLTKKKMAKNTPISLVPTMDLYYSLKKKNIYIYIPVWAIWISWFCWCFHKSVWSTRMRNPRPPTLRKTFEAQLLQFTLGIIFELKTPLVSEGGRYVVTSLKPSKRLMKWKPFKRLKEPGCFQHSRHVFFQGIDGTFIFATLPRCWTVPHSTQSSRRRSYHERGMLYCQCWNSNTHGWAMTFQHICCKIWGFTEYTFHIKRSLCKKNSPKLQIYESWWGHIPNPNPPLGTATENRVHMCDQQRNCWIPSVMFMVGSMFFFQWIIVIVVPKEG